MSVASILEFKQRGVCLRSVVFTERAVDRLLQRVDFQDVMAAEVVSRTRHFVLHRRVINTPCPTSSRIGVVVPKRWAKRAVTRNTIKRQIYTLMDDIEGRLPPADHVVRLRSAFDKEKFISATSPLLKQAIRSELHQLLARVLQA
jgi:ribonuclease P protein component